MISTDQFRKQIQSQLELAAAQVTVLSSIYRTLCKRPVVNSWMIFCCNAMRAEMTEADNLIFDYANDTLLTVNYRLTRN
jgi:hypothetical protein